MLRLALLAAICLGAACGQPPGEIIDAAPLPDVHVFDAGLCGDHVMSYEPEASPHVPAGMTVDYDRNPPSSGPHDPIWAHWQRTYSDPPMPREHWVHNLEHGGVVFLYNCPSGCDDIVQGLEALQDSLPVDDLCVAPITSRSLITADPLLPADVKVAAVAWGVVYTATCLDTASMRAFAVAHRGHGPESLCRDGAYPVP